MLVRRSVIEEVGGLDEGYFIYSEEIDWCRRIGQAGYTILTAPAAQVIHFGGQSTGQVPDAMFQQLHRSRARYFRRYHGPRFLRRIARAATLAAWIEALRGGPRAAALTDVARLYAAGESEAGDG